MDEDTFKHFGKATFLSQIKLVRMRRGLRQLDLARLIKVSESYLSKIETDRVVPNEALLLRMAGVLDVAVTDLAGDQPPTSTGPHD